MPISINGGTLKTVKVSSENRVERVRIQEIKSVKNNSRSNRNVGAYRLTRTTSPIETDNALISSVAHDGPLRLRQTEVLRGSPRQRPVRQSRSTRSETLTPQSTPLSAKHSRLLGRVHVSFLYASRERSLTIRLSAPRRHPTGPITLFRAS